MPGWGSSKFNQIDATKMLGTGGFTTQNVNSAVNVHRQFLKERKTRLNSKARVG